MNNIQRKILEILNQGRDHAKTADEIVTELSLSYDRTNITIINEMKLNP